MNKIKQPKNSSSPAHDPEAALTETIEVTIDEIALSDYEIIDIREPDEVAQEPLPFAHRHIPMNDLISNPAQIIKDKAYLLVCAAGVRTKYTANAFRAAGFNNVYSLVGGLAAVQGYTYDG